MNEAYAYHVAQRQDAATAKLEQARPTLFILQEENVRTLIEAADEEGGAQLMGLGTRWKPRSSSLQGPHGGKLCHFVVYAPVAYRAFDDVLITREVVFWSRMVSSLC